PKTDVVDNQRNWIACIKSGETPHATIEIGRRTADVVHLGNIATRLGRTLRFDSPNQRFANDEEATRLLGRTYREGGHWGVPTAS
ncbi:MAG: gfo/Idh/MocA family oxidoreductase, partial [Pirellulales bacterium]|nr:gfo/Idh/MocA family oxidoreductase [Pirellulales bacterium]